MSRTRAVVRRARKFHHCGLDYIGPQIKPGDLYIQHTESFPAVKAVTPILLGTPYGWRSAETVPSDMAGATCSFAREAAEADQLSPDLLKHQDNTMTDQCTSRTISGAQCNKPASHDGQHQIIRPTWTYEWTDETEAAEAERLNKRRY